MRIVSWITSAWSDPGHRATVIADYAALKGLRHVLADMALRGHVFSVPPAPPDLYQAGVNEGRRQMAIETMRLAGTDPATLQKLCFEPAKKD